jgi:hypothetical protein
MPLIVADYCNKCVNIGSERHTNLFRLVPYYLWSRDMLMRVSTFPFLPSYQEATNLNCAIIIFYTPAAHIIVDVCSSNFNEGSLS